MQQRVWNEVGKWNGLLRVESAYQIYPAVGVYQCWAGHPCTTGIPAGVSHGYVIYPRGAPKIFAPTGIPILVGSSRVKTLRIINTRPRKNFWGSIPEEIV